MEHNLFKGSRGHTSPEPLAVLLLCFSILHMCQRQEAVRLSFWGYLLILVSY